jgi:hypothetical protein
VILTEDDGDEAADEETSVGGSAETEQQMILFEFAGRTGECETDGEQSTETVTGSDRYVQVAVHSADSHTEQGDEQQEGGANAEQHSDAMYGMLHHQLRSVRAQHSTDHGSDRRSL